MSYVPGLSLAPAFVYQFGCWGLSVIAVDVDVRQLWFLMPVPPSSRAACISVWCSFFLLTTEDRCEVVKGEEACGEEVLFPTEGRCYLDDV